MSVVTQISWKEIEEQAESGDLFLFSETDWIGRVIEFATGGKFAHSAMVFKGPDGLQLWETDPIIIATDPLNPNPIAPYGAQLGNLYDALAHINDNGNTPYFRKLVWERPTDFNHRLAAVIHELDGRVPFGTGNENHQMLEMAENYIKGHYLGIQGPLNEVYCAELVAMTYEKVGLLGTERPTNFYSPSSFSSASNDVVLLHGQFAPERQLSLKKTPPTPHSV